MRAEVIRGRSYGIVGGRVCGVCASYYRVRGRFVPHWRREGEARGRGGPGGDFGKSIRPILSSRPCVVVRGHAP